MFLILLIETEYQHTQSTRCVLSENKMIKISSLKLRHMGSIN